MQLKVGVGHQLPGFRVAEDYTTAANGAWFNFRVRNGFGWIPRPMAGNPKIGLRVSVLNVMVCLRYIPTLQHSEESTL